MNSSSPKVQPEIPLVDLAAQYASIAVDIDRAIDTVLKRGDYVLGRDVGAFEEEFAIYGEAEHAVAVDSGTSALELALRACGIEAGDEVITAANTFIATVLAISHVGATPVLVDVDPITYCIDVGAAERALTRRTAAIIPVHLYGHPADMDPILDLAKRRKLRVIEDACQAHGARYKGRRVGSFGDAAAFSFYPGKNLGAYGDGGIVVTNDRHIAAEVALLRNYGQKEKYHHLSRGFNRRLDTLQAAVLRAKLPYLDGWNDDRRKHATSYQRLLSSTGVTTPQIADYAEPVWHLFVVRTVCRDLLQQHLADRGIATGIHYPIPIHLQPAYRDLGYQRGDFPITERAAQCILSLPMYPELSPHALETIVDAVCSFVTMREPVTVL